MYYFIFLISFIGSSGLCALIDFNFPKFRLTKKKNENIYEDYKKILPVVVRNLIISYPIFYYSEYYLFMIDNIKNNNYYYYTITYILLWYILSDLFFYMVHRFFHTKTFYFLHKKHHEFNNPYGIGAIYCGIMEMVFSNLLSLLLPVYFIEVPENLVLKMIVGMTFWTVFMSHGCFQEINHSHVIHHRKLTCNYGLFITDRIFGTKEKKYK
tara:strand:- start:454 stop:1086 length:633 start_codon:yes stop_codon:yes gene_type:complete